MHGEYNNSAVNGSPCSYATLSNYNNGSSFGPAVAPTTVSGHYIVPTYSAPGYNALTHNVSVPSCSGYFNIQNAYGANADQCSTQYTTRLCQ